MKEIAELAYKNYLKSCDERIEAIEKDVFIYYILLKCNKQLLKDTLKAKKVDSYVFNYNFITFRLFAESSDIQLIDNVSLDIPKIFQEIKESV